MPIAEAAGAPSAIAVLTTPSALPPQVLVNTTAPTTWAAYVDHFSRVDPVATATFAEPPGRLLRALDTEWGAELPRGEFYNDFMVPARTPHVAAAWVAVSDTVHMSVGLHSEAQLRAGAIELVEVFLPHLARAAALSLDLRRAGYVPNADPDPWELCRGGVRTDRWDDALKAMRLTPRQGEVLAWLETGQTKDEVARILGCSIGTVKTHVREATRRLGVHGRVAAIAALRDQLEPKSHALPEDELVRSLARWTIDRPPRFPRPGTESGFGSGSDV